MLSPESRTDSGMAGEALINFLPHLSCWRAWASLLHLSSLKANSIDSTSEKGISASAGALSLQFDALFAPCAHTRETIHAKCILISGAHDASITNLIKNFTPLCGKEEATQPLLLSQHGASPFFILRLYILLKSVPAAFLRHRQSVYCKK
jgi:hypothetical protein